MARRFYNLPSLTALAAFEAAGRHQSFKKAARELSVTPGAISHQIKSLEDEVEVALFLRQHRGVTLTEEGQLLFDVLGQSFSDIAHVLAQLRARSFGDFVTVGATSAVAALWLSPTINRFWRKHPKIQVSQLIHDRISERVLELDIFIKYGWLETEDLDQAELYRDHLLPVGHRTLTDRLRNATLADIASQPLIHLDSGNAQWTSWKEWFAALGYHGPISNGIRVNNYAIALQAAEEGIGLALGWHRLVSPMLERGQLCFFDTFQISAPQPFVLISKPTSALSADALALKRWIMESTQTK